MKKVKTEHSDMVTDDVLPEYNFQGRKGVRGRYYRAYRQGHMVRVHEADGSVHVQYFTLAADAVMLEPDVRAYFPTSEAVNQTLRSLIALVPAKTPKRKTPVKSPRTNTKHRIGGQR